MLEQKLLEEIQRFKTISKNANNLNEQAVPAGPAPEAEALPPIDAPAAGGEEPAPGAEAPAAAPTTETMPDSTEEVDVTELVNMTKNIKSDVESTKGEHQAVIQKMDDAFSKLSELESKLAQMDQVLVKIDELGAKIETMKPPTPVEKLEMRSLDSYPFNQKPNDFFSLKQEEMKASGKNEYVLTKSDIENYSNEQIAQTFNPTENEIKF